jgi:hypothetical protein
MAQQPKEERTVEIIVNGTRANASLKEMNAAAAVLYNQFQKLSADDPGRAKIVADYQAMRGRINDVKSELTGVVQTTGMMKQAFTNAFALFTGGGLVQLAQKLFGFFSASREEALASAKSSADLDATLKSTAHSAGLTAEEIRKIGTERAKVTLFDDDETNQASALLLTFTNIKKGVFEEAMPAIQDLATKMGGDGPADMKGAAIQVGKALNDPVKGITALTRVGVSFTEQQKEQITQLVKAGNAAGAQKLILAELNKEFGGSAEAARKAAGGMATLSMWFGEFKETVGGQVNQVLDMLSQWLGRVIDKSQPLLDMVTELVDQFGEYYHEIGDILVSLGLFNDKTDTAGIAVATLKYALQLLLMPLKLLLEVSKEVVDNFIDWYNKSELLRGVLGGLGATAVQIFTTIKDAAINILGGVGDIIVGIFTVDKDRIARGLKATLSATADVMLDGGNKAAEAFWKGYDANKNNHITRTVRVKTQEEGAADKLEPGAGQVADAGESEKDRKAREAAEKKAAEAALKARLAEIEAWKHHQEMLLNLQEAASIARDDERAVEIAKIWRDGQRKIVALQAAEKEAAAKVEGTTKQKAVKIAALEQELAAQVNLIQTQARADQQQKLQKYLEDDQKLQKEFIDSQLSDIDEDTARKQAAFDVMAEAGLQSQLAADEAKYSARQAAFDQELALIEASLGKESAEYKRVQAAQLKDQQGFSKKEVADREKAFKQKQALQKMEMSTAGDVISFGLELLGQDAEARKKHHSLYTSLAAAKIVIDGTKEVAQIWEYSAENPANGPTMGAAGIAMGAIQTAVAVARTAVALSKLGGGGGDSGDNTSYAKGGATGTGAGLAVSPLGQLMAMSGMSVGAGGKLQDGSGFAVAGVVHEDEYVIPKWQLADPQVAAVAQWLEARRLRGFADGGPTSGSSGAALPVAAASPSTDGEKSYAVQTQMLDAMLLMNSQLADVKQWQRELQVRLDLRAAQARIDEHKQVEYDSKIRSKRP